METVTRIIFAFVRQPTWTQAALSREVDVQTRTVRKHLDAFVASGVPLEREEDHPHVYWSVPRGWLPSGAAFQHRELTELARLVARHPKTDAREKLLARLLRAAPGSSVVRSDAELAGEESVLAVIEDGAASHRTVRLRYFSASRGDRGARSLSVHRIESGASVRFVATCHRSGSLKWFRIDRADHAVLTEEPFREADPETVDEFIAESFDGFHGPEAVEVSFRLRWPEARWALRTLPAGHQTDLGPTQVEVRLRTSALDVLARHLVGLGDLVDADPPLRERIAALARAALDANT